MKRLIPIVLAFFALVGAGCDQSTPVEHDHTYTVQGTVTDVKGDAARIHHEAVPDFVNQDGEKVGMDSMTMGFQLPQEPDAKGLKAGDKIEFTFEVNWTENPRLRIKSYEVLEQAKKAADASETASDS